MFKFYIRNAFILIIIIISVISSMPFTDDQIRQAVMNLFKKYDGNNSGYIDSGEIQAMCNDLAKELASKKQLTPEQINQTLSTIDKNQDGKLSRDEVFILMRKLNP